MKIEQNSTALIEKQVTEEYSYRLDNKNLPFLFKLLRGAYSDKIGSIVREYTCNCIDAHIEALKPNEKVKIIYHRNNILTGDYDAIEFRDNGTGISPERMIEVFTSYLTSTKRESNELIGAFGLGSKSFFSYSDSFYISTRVDGIIYTYMAYIDESQIGKIALLNQQETDEENGTSIIGPLLNPDDIHLFIHAIKRQLIYINNIEFIGFPNLERYEYQQLNDKYTYCKTLGFHVIVGNISYTVEYDSLEYENSPIVRDGKLNGIGIKLAIGEVDLTPYRESLEYTAKTKKRIIEEICNLQEFARDYIKIVVENDPFELFLLSLDSNLSNEFNRKMAKLANILIDYSRVSRFRDLKKLDGYYVAKNITSGGIADKKYEAKIENIASSNIFFNKIEVSRLFTEFSTSNQFIFSNTSKIDYSLLTDTKFNRYTTILKAPDFREYRQTLITIKELKQSITKFSKEIFSLRKSKEDNTKLQTLIDTRDYDIKGYNIITNKDYLENIKRKCSENIKLYYEFLDILPDKYKVTSTRYGQIDCLERLNKDRKQYRDEYLEKVRLSKKGKLKSEEIEVEIIYDTGISVDKKYQYFPKEYIKDNFNRRTHLFFNSRETKDGEQICKLLNLIPRHFQSKTVICIPKVKESLFVTKIQHINDYLKTTEGMKDYEKAIAQLLIDKPKVSYAIAFILDKVKDEFYDLWALFNNCRANYEEEKLKNISYKEKQDFISYGINELKFSFSGENILKIQEINEWTDKLFILTKISTHEITTQQLRSYLKQLGVKPSSNFITEIDLFTQLKEEHETIAC